ncbi:MAG: hypothetical protein ACLFUW_08585 [Bacteroidales bacterium]
MELILHIVLSKFALELIPRYDSRSRVLSTMSRAINVQTPGFGRLFLFSGITISEIADLDGILPCPGTRDSFSIYKTG